MNSYELINQSMDEGFDWQEDEGKCQCIYSVANLRVKHDSELDNFRGLDDKEWGDMGAYG